MTRLGVAMCIVIGFGLSACATNPTLSSYKPKNPDEALVITMLQRIPGGIRAKSVEIILQAYADDVYVGNFHKYLGVAGPGSPTSLRGRDEVRQVYLTIMRNVKDVTLEVRDFRLTVSGDRAVAEGLLELSFKLEAGRREAREDWVRNDVLWRMRRTPAGWKIHEEIFQ